MLEKGAKVNWNSLYFFVYAHLLSGELAVKWQHVSLGYRFTCGCSFKYQAFKR